MAKRYGGKHSPDGRGPSPDMETVARVDERSVDAAGGRANILFAPAVVLAFMSINETAIVLALGLIGAGILALAAWLTRDGLRAHAAYDARKVARRPAIPRKIFGSVLTGAGIGLASLANAIDFNDNSTAGLGFGVITASVIFGLAASGLHLAAFGVDPLRNKRMDGVDTFQQDRVAKVVDEAEAHLNAMRDHIDALKDRRLSGRVEQFQTAARRMIRTVEEDPRDLTGARKFLGVYLMGARDAAVKFADLYKRTGDQDARADFEDLLGDLEQNFAARTEKMLLDDRTDVDIEIKVLRDRLQREGL